MLVLFSLVPVAIGVWWWGSEGMRERRLRIGGERCRTRLVRPCRSLLGANTRLIRGTWLRGD